MAEIENLESTKKRLNEIENELQNLKLTEANLKERWESEKKIIYEIRHYKSEIV